MKAEKKREIDALAAENKSLAAANLSLRTKCDTLEEESRAHMELKRKFVQLEHEHENQLSNLHQRLNIMYKRRTLLLNRVLNLQGTITVYARVRPPTSAEGNRALCGWSYGDDSSLKIWRDETSAGDRRQLKHEFTFEQVFEPYTSQEEVFEVVSPLIQSALEGFKVCIFTYGKIAYSTIDAHTNIFWLICCYSRVKPESDRPKHVSRHI